MVLEQEFWGSVRAEEKPMADWRERSRAMLMAIRITGAACPQPVETSATRTLGLVIAGTLRACESGAIEPEAAA